MHSGLLWYDSVPGKPLVTKIKDAAKRYEKKFGIPPNVAYVNPNDYVGFEAKTLPQIVVSQKATVLRNHIWLGLDERLALAGESSALHLTVPVVAPELLSQSESLKGAN